MMRFIWQNASFFDFLFKSYNESKMLDTFLTIFALVAFTRRNCNGGENTEFLFSLLQNISKTFKKIMQTQIDVYFGTIPSDFNYLICLPP